MVLAEQSKITPPVTMRVYTPNITNFSRVVVEWEYEDLASYEESWAKWAALPSTPEFMDKWYKITKTGGKSEIWNLEE